MEAKAEVVELRGSHSKNPTYKALIVNGFTFKIPAAQYEHPDSGKYGLAQGDPKELIEWMVKIINEHGSLDIPGLRKTFFTINEHLQNADVPYFEGYTDGTAPIGWERPYFTFEVAMKILEWQQGLGEDHEYSTCAYDESSDSFIWDFEVKVYGSEYDGYKGESIGGEHLYRIGDGWIWAIVDEDYKRRYDAREEE